MTYPQPRLASFLLRSGIAVAFLYAAIAAFLTPDNWIGFLPRGFQSPALLLPWGLVEIALALWLLSGWRLRQAALVSAVVLSVIILFNLTSLDIVFRDVPILAAALALWYL